MIPRSLKAKTQRGAVWALHDPKRLQRLGIVGLATFAFGLSGAGVSALSSLTPAPLVSPAAAAGTAGPAAATVPAPAAAERWATLWFGPASDPTDWRAALTGVSTNRFTAYLLQVNPATIEKTTVASSRIVLQSPTSTEVEVTTGTGERIVLTLLPGGRGDWRVDTFEPVAEADVAHDEDHPEGGA